jgi:hypothetical protein
MIKTVRKTVSKNKKRVTKKMNKNKQKGGALYSFDLNDKVGGLPARVSLNGTADGDCPSGKITDFGMNNYQIARGGSKSKKSKSKKSKSKKSKSKKSKSKKSKSKKSKSKKH